MFLGLSQHGGNPLKHGGHSPENHGRTSFPYGRKSGKNGGYPWIIKKRHPLNESFSYWDSFPACILSPCLFPCDFWLSLCPTIIQSSLGWFQGKSAGHPHYFKGKKPWFPVDFPFNPSSDPNFSVLLQTLNLDTKHVYLVACGKSHAWNQLIITIFTI